MLLFLRENAFYDQECFVLQYLKWPVGKFANFVSTQYLSTSMAWFCDVTLPTFAVLC